MKTSTNTVLITGGSAGIGFEIAKALSEKGNKVIITGRNEDRLNKAKAQLKNVTSIVSDVSKEEDVNKLHQQLQRDFPELNIVINNAGAAQLFDLANDADVYSKAKEEILTNYLSIIRLTDKLLPTLKKQKEAAIINVSSLVSFVPSIAIATYSASKAALHSYTQSLRSVLEETSVKVFELMPPLVNTEFSEAIGGSNGIAPKVVADDLVQALETDHYEIHVGNTAYVYGLTRTAPEQAWTTINPKKLIAAE